MAAQYYISNISWHSEVKKGESTNITLTVENKGTEGAGFYKITSLTAGRDFCKGGLDIAAGGRRYVRCSSTVMDQEGYERFLCQVGHWDPGHVLVVDHQRTITIHVIEEEQPPPPPPPPPENKWDLTVETSVSQAEVSISGPITATKTADTDGTAVFYDLKEGEYTITAAKTGYKTASKTITLNKNMTVNVFPEYIPPPQTCTPGEKKCMNGNLYICNQQGSGWELYEENSPVCQETGGCPDFWTDPIGAVVCWILSFLDQALHLATGGFLTLIANVKNFLNNYSTAIINFISDPIRHVRDYVLNKWTWLNDVVGKITSVITGWWNSTAKTVQSWINNAFAQAWNWITSTGKWLVDTVNNLLQQTGSWLTNLWKNAVEFWNDITQHIWDWWNSSIKAVWDYIQNIAISAWNFIKNIGTWIANWWQTIWIGVKAFIDNAVNTAISFFQSLFQTLWTAIDNVKKWVIDYIAARIAELLNLINAGGASIQDLLNTVIENIKEWVQNYFMESLKGMFGWIEDLKDSIAAVINAFLNLYGILTGEEEIPGVEGDIAEKYKELMQNTEDILED